MKQNANDPRVQEYVKLKAKEAAVAAAGNFKAKALDIGAQGLDAFKKYVQGGPAGIQMLSFLSAGTTAIRRVLSLYYVDCL